MKHGYEGGDQITALIGWSIMHTLKQSPLEVVLPVRLCGEQGWESDYIEKKENISLTSRCCVYPGPKGNWVLMLARFGGRRD